MNLLTNIFQVMSKDMHSVFVGLITTLISFVFGIFWLWARRNIYFYLIVKRKIISLILNKKYIVVWNDYRPETSKAITSWLKKKKLKNYIYKEIKEPEELLYYPSNSNYTHLIILIVMDVTKLSESESNRHKIQEKLSKYVENGGMLLGTHDLIYRRCRNIQLQKLFGCELFQFARCNSPIKAVINTQYQNHPVLKGIPNYFEFDDGEVVYGEWDDDTHKLALSSETFYDSNVKVPLICLKQHANKGLTVWLSPGDMGLTLPQSIERPSIELLTIIYNLIKLHKEIKNYQY